MGSACSIYQKGPLMERPADPVLTGLSVIHHSCMGIVRPRLPARAFPLNNQEVI